MKLILNLIFLQPVFIGLIHIWGCKHKNIIKKLKFKDDDTKEYIYKNKTYGICCFAIGLIVALFGILINYMYDIFIMNIMCSFLVPMIVYFETIFINVLVDTRFKVDEMDKNNELDKK